MVPNMSCNACRQQLTPSTRSRSKHGSGQLTTGLAPCPTMFATPSGPPLGPDPVRREGLFHGNSRQPLSPHLNATSRQRIPSRAARAAERASTAQVRNTHQWNETGVAFICGNPRFRFPDRLHGGASGDRTLRLSSLV